MSDLEKTLNNANKVMASDELKPYKTIGRRFLAGMVDGSINFAFSMLVILPITLLHDQIESVVFWTIVLPVQHLYAIVTTKLLGGTIGKVLFNLRVLDSKSEAPITMFQSFRREIVNIATTILYLVPMYWFMLDHGGFSVKDYSAYSTTHPILVVITLLSGAIALVEIGTSLGSPKRRALHDLVAGTVVKINGDYKKAYIWIAIAVYIGAFVAYFRVFDLMPK